MTTETTVYFTTPGYLPGTYSISIEGEEFAALWEECTALDRILVNSSHPEFAAATVQWPPRKGRANKTALAALNDPKLEAFFADDPVGFELANESDEKDLELPAIPWNERFTHQHPFNSAKELMALIGQVGWDGPIVIDTPFMAGATALQITEHEFCLV